MNYIVTYNFENTANRADFIEGFEQVLAELGLEKEETNQSTYFGFFARTRQEFVRELLNGTRLLEWEMDDVVTIYYPKPTERVANIGRHPFKSAGILERIPNIIL